MYKLSQPRFFSTVFFLKKTPVPTGHPCSLVSDAVDCMVHLREHASEIRIKMHHSMATTEVYSNAKGSLFDALIGYLWMGILPDPIMITA